METTAKTDIRYLKTQLSGKHLKLTKQREVILDTFLKNDHITAEHLYQQLSQKQIHFGLATVYRTLKLLCELGIGQERHFGDHQTTFDNVLHKEHHDHLICQKCGKIVEFECPGIEKLQEEMAEQHGFILQNHRLELYGCCKDVKGCNKRKKTKTL